MQGPVDVTLQKNERSATLKPRVASVKRMTKDPQVYQKDKPETIQAMFGSIAKSYDRTNAVLSFQLHKIWNKKLVQCVMGSDDPNTLLDLCCGTGEISFAFLRQSQASCNVHMLDFCAEMLQCAKEKARVTNLDQQHQLNYIQADAQDIPLPDASVDRVTVAYGIRNVANPAVCSQEVFRVLRPGGTFGILELTQPQNPFLRFGHQIYLRTLLPVLGWCFSANQEAYQYLCNSINGFIKPVELERILLDAGFQKTARIPLSGGIATILLATKGT